MIIHVFKGISIIPKTADSVKLIFLFITSITIADKNMENSIKVNKYNLV